VGVGVGAVVGTGVEISGRRSGRRVREVRAGNEVWAGWWLEMEVEVEVGPGPHLRERRVARNVSQQHCTGALGRARLAMDATAVVEIVFIASLDLLD